MQSRSITIRFPPKLIERIEAQVKAQGQTMSDVVRECCEQAFSTVIEVQTALKQVAELQQGHKQLQIALMRLNFETVSYLRDGRPESVVTETKRVANERAQATAVALLGSTD